nr:dermokine isoform X1 [Manis javanica]XP_017518874.2 dermokine isoform X1 [Manis javanica]XP_017518875.2 dermokine isoform X1 [Manis javanica]
MKLQGCLACLLLALCLSSGEAVPLLNREGNAAASAGEAIGHGVGEVVGKGVRDVISQGAGELADQGAEEAASSGMREAMGTLLGEAAHLGVEEAFHKGMEGAVHALGNVGGEAGREAENLVRHGADVSHGSWQGMLGTNSAWGTHDQPPSGGPRGYSQGNPGGPGTPLGPGPSGGSDSRFGTPSQGSSGGHRGNGGPANLGTDAQKAVARRGQGSTRSSSSLNTECINSPPAGSDGSSGSSGESGGQSTPAPQESGGRAGNSGSSSEPGWDQPQNSGNFDQSSYAEPQVYNSGYSSESSRSRGGNKPGCDNTGNEVRVSGGSGGQQWSVGGEEAVRGITTVNTQMAPGLFNFDSFWKNFKSKLSFINWEAINKGQVSPPSTRALLYFSRLWEDFKHNTPFFNWKVITEGANVPPLQKRAGGAGQGEATVSS